MFEVPQYQKYLKQDWIPHACFSWLNSTNGTGGGRSRRDLHPQRNVLVLRPVQAQSASPLQLNPQGRSKNRHPGL